MNNISITWIPPAYVDGLWDSASVLLKKAVELSENSHDLDSLYEEIMSGSHDLWAIFKEDDDLLAVFTTQLCKYPRKTSLAITFCGSHDRMGGVSGYWNEAMNQLVSIALSYGIESIEIIGRRGWTRVFRDMGFKEVAVVSEMKLKEQKDG